MLASGHTTTPVDYPPAPNEKCPAIAWRKAPWRSIPRGIATGYADKTLTGRRSRKIPCA